MRTSKRRTMVLAIAAMVLAIGCEGAVNLQGDGSEKFGVPVPGNNVEASDPPPGTIMRDPDEVTDESCRFISPGETPLRRLTEDEYNNTVRDLFPNSEIPRHDLSADEKVAGFDANVVAPVTELMAEEYQGAAEDISEIAIDQEPAFDCGSMGEDECARQFIDELGARAFRRPLTQSEEDAMFALYTDGKSEFDHQTGMQLVVEGTLQSPNFLYRIESGEVSEDDVVQLTDYEIASRLSYFLWGSMPDEALFEAAEAGQLQDSTEVEKHARRMLRDPRARNRINEIVEKWLRVDQLQSVDKMDEAFDEDLRDSMMAETRAFIDHVIWEDDGRVSTLLGADYTFVDQRLADLYGVEYTGSGDEMVRVQLPEGRRGLMTHPGVLATFGHGQMPVHRGKFIRESFFCTTPPEPPDEITPLPTYEGESLRSKAEKRLNATDEGCAGCHSMMDGLGLVFDNFDSLGRYQTEDEHGNTLDDAGEITATGELNGAVDGVDEFVDRIKDSEQVRTCVSRQFFRYAFARMVAGSDECTMHMMEDALARSDNDIKELIVAVVTTDAFLYRQNPSMAQ